MGMVIAFQAGEEGVWERFQPPPLSSIAWGTSYSIQVRLKAENKPDCVQMQPFLSRKKDRESADGSGEAILGCWRHN